MLPPGGGAGLGGIGGKGIAASFCSACSAGWPRVSTRSHERVGLRPCSGALSQDREGLNYNCPIRSAAWSRSRSRREEHRDRQSVGGDRGAGAGCGCLMLTSDENIVDIAFSVQWRISTNARELRVNIQTGWHHPRPWPKAPCARWLAAVRCRTCCRARVAAVQAATPAGAAAAAAATQANAAASAASRPRPSPRSRIRCSGTIQTILDSYAAGVIIDG